MYLIISESKGKRKPSLFLLEQHTECVIQDAFETGTARDCVHSAIPFVGKERGMIHKTSTDSNLPAPLTKPEFNAGPPSQKCSEEY